MAKKTKKNGKSINNSINSTNAIKSSNSIINSISSNEFESRSSEQVYLQVHLSPDAHGSISKRLYNWSNATNSDAITPSSDNNLTNIYNSNSISSDSDNNNSGVKRKADDLVLTGNISVQSPSRFLTERSKDETIEGSYTYAYIGLKCLQMCVQVHNIRCE